MSILFMSDNLSYKSIGPAGRGAVMNLSKKTDDRLTTTAIVIVAALLMGFVIMSGIDAIGHMVNI